MKSIIKEIRLRLPYNINEDDIVLYINSAIRRYGRHIGIYRSQMLKLSGNRGELGSICPECIKAVFCGDREITDYKLHGGEIILNGKPGKEITVYHTSCNTAKTRDEAGEDFDNQDLKVDSEYIDAVVFSVAADYMETAEDITAANNYRAKCDEIVRSAMQGKYIKRGKYPVTKNVLFC